MVSGGAAQFSLPTTMANLEIFVWVLGNFPASQRTFQITVPASESVGHLRDLVYGESQNTFKGIDVKQLILWKVLPFCPFPIIYILTGCLNYQLRTPILANDVDTEVPTIGQDLPAVASMMSPIMRLTNYFSLPLSPESLHVIVEPPLNCKSSGLSRGGSPSPLCNQ
jgi:hypothetical protein